MESGEQAGYISKTFFHDVVWRGWKGLPRGPLSFAMESPGGIHPDFTPEKRVGGAMVEDIQDAFSNEEIAFEIYLVENRLEHSAGTLKAHIGVYERRGLGKTHLPLAPDRAHEPSGVAGIFLVQGHYHDVMEDPFPWHPEVAHFRV